MATKKTTSTKSAAIKDPSLKLKKATKVVINEAVKYIEALGKRKTAVARVRLMKGLGITVNSRDYKDYFKTDRMRAAALEALTSVGLDKEYAVSALIKGGGLSAQAEALRHGISRAIIKIDGELKKRLRKLGFVTRDSRMVERKKYGFKKARRAPQWQKR